MLLRLLLLLLLPFAAVADSAEAEFNIALLWPEANVESQAHHLFENNFRPKLAAACPTAANVTVNFTELLLFQWPTLEQIRTVSSTLSNSTSTLLGACCMSSAIPQPISTQPITAASRPSAETVAAALATVAALIAPSSTTLANDPIALVVGSEYPMENLHPLVTSFPAGVMTFSISDSSSVVENIRDGSSFGLVIVVANHSETEAFMRTAADGYNWDPNQRWLVYGSALATQQNVTNWLKLSLNVTSMGFPTKSGNLFAKSEALSSTATTRQLLLHDLVAVGSKLIENSVCSGTEPNSSILVEGVTGAFSVHSNGSVARENWLWQVYRGLGMQATQIGTISSNGSNNMTSAANERNYTKSEVLASFQEKDFRVIVVIDSPFVKYKEGFENRTDLELWDRLEGAIFDVCQLLLQRLNITRIKVQQQRTIGMPQMSDTSSWSGSVGNLQSGRSDMICARLLPLAAMSKAIDISDAIATLNLSVLYQRASTDPVREMFQFIYPFQSRTWLTVVGSVIAFAFVLSVLHALSPNQQSFDPGYSLFFAFASLMQGLTGRPPDRPSAQVAIALFWLFVFSLLVAYVATYAAVRTLDRLQADISSVQNLLTLGKWQFGVEADSPAVSLFRDSSFAYMRQLHAQMQLFPLGNFPNSSVAMAAVASGSFAMISDNIGNNYRKHFICNSQVAGHFQSTRAVIGLAKHSHLLPLVNSELQHMRISGMLSDLVQSHTTPSTQQQQQSEQQCSQQQSQPFTWIPSEPPQLQEKFGALTLKNTLGIFVINVAGCLLTLSVALAEKFCSRCRVSDVRNRLSGSGGISGVKADNFDTFSTGGRLQQRRRSTFASVQADSFS